jgi:DNA-directed RNA polymerase specialized sigma24 family protein
MTSHFDLPDATLLILVARLDRDALAELFRRYCVVVLIAAGWTEQRKDDAERIAVDVFLDVWRRPEAYAAGLHSTRSRLIRAALRDAPDDCVPVATARLAELEGWTYHDVAEALARPSRHVARSLRKQLAALRDDTGP